jgi:hypothetical protein
MPEFLGMPRTFSARTLVASIEAGRPFRLHHRLRGRIGLAAELTLSGRTRSKVQAQIADTGYEPFSSSPEEFAHSVAAETEK